MAEVCKIFQTWRDGVTKTEITDQTSVKISLLKWWQTGGHHHKDLPSHIATATAYGWFPSENLPSNKTEYDNLPTQFLGWWRFEHNIHAQNQL